ncbi:ribonuclease J [Faecalicoccus pleomorphus]|uniref:ribonuclease J n=1 Tax=Faecalicoccus pleomorphus TaxID=1323 RepID=UPI00196165C7|nr:ribonuclease J [Faecalicoccus pleomorphus]MBM6677540.1 ribonuclease J [Faecalicoccus pleomorphus]MBM6764912.1 ribonuclease J [Faecalicoccus pleomorphus]MDB7986092.1 ribonuclease J [Faecalicoccus pleomorphus]MDB7990862.1 ribonuclease J [Faecalicoccus pleomorphus]
MKNKNNKEISSVNERIRIFCLGGLDEDGKNMMVVEVDQDIYIIEAGIKFPEEKESLGIEFIVQDFTYLIENQDRIAGIFITHGHDDVMGALPYLMKNIKANIYTSPLASKAIHKVFKKERITGSKIYTIKRHDQRKIGAHKVVFFPVTHAYPGTFGLAISTSQGYVVYSGEFIEDYDDLHDSYRGDFTTCSKLGNEGVLVLLQESKGAERSGHTAPNHRITEKFSQVLEQTDHNRVFVSVYTQSVYRIQEIIECCIQYDRPMIFYSKELRELVANLEDFNVSIPKKLVLDPSYIKEAPDNVVVIISGQGKSLFKTMSNIANNEVEDIVFTQNDVIVIASPVIPGVEKVFKSMENDIYKEEGTILVLDRNVLSMHPSKEDLKMMLFLMKPKYYIPVKGEYRHLYMNSEIALEMGYKPSQIILLDNGQVATFENQKLRSCSMELELHDVMIDGKENWDMAGVVLKDREILSTDGVMILAIGLDAKTKKIINGPDIQTRGLIYVKDAEYITTDVGKILEDTIQEAVANKTYDNLTTRNEIRDKISKYLYKQTAKRPMVLPVILEINNQ